MIVVFELKINWMNLKVGGRTVKMVFLSYDLHDGQVLYKQGVNFHLKPILYLFLSV